MDINTSTAIKLLVELKRNMWNSIHKASRLRGRERVKVEQSAINMYYGARWFYATLVNSDENSIETIVKNELAREESK